MNKLLLVPCLLALSAAAASGGVIFSTGGGPTPGFFPSNGSTSTSSVFHSFQFTVGAGQGGVLDQLVTAGLSSTSFAEVFYIRSDSAGNRGSILDTISVAVTGDSTGRLYSGTSTNHPTLASGSTYWIEAASPSGSDSFLWLEGNPITTTREFSSATGYFNGQPAAAFALLEVPASGVPEPGTCLVTVASLAALALRRRR